MNKITKRTRGLTALACLAIASSWAIGAKAADKVTLRLDWTTTAYHAPFYVAQERGYFAKANIEVDILEGKGSGNAVQLVGNGTDTFGFVDATTAAKAATLGVPVKVVMGIMQTSSAAIFFPAESPIQSAKDLKGKSILSCPGHAALLLLPAFLETAGLKMSDIKILNVDCGSLYRLAAEKTADAATGTSPAAIGFFDRVEKPVRYIDYADAGINWPAHGIITNKDTIKNKPDVIKRFVAAVAQGWADTIKNPDEAIQLMANKKPIVKGNEKNFALQLRSYLKYATSPGTKGKPFGWQSAEEWKAAEQLMVKYLDVKPGASVDTYFTNEFVASK